MRTELYTDDDVALAKLPLVEAGIDNWLDTISLAEGVLEAVLPAYLGRLADELHELVPCRCRSCSALKGYVRARAGGD